MNHQPRTQLRLKPSCLGRHDVARIGDVHQLLHGNGIEGQCHFHLTAVHPLLQLFQTTDATYKVDTLVGTEVFDAKHFIQYQIGGDGYIQYTNGVVIIISTRGLNSLRMKRISANAFIRKRIFLWKIQNSHHNLIIKCFKRDSGFCPT